RRHAVPNALLPSVTMIFMHLGTLVTGAITVEAVYSWPGLGYLTYQALKIPDLPLLEGTFIVFSASVIVMNLFADLVYRFLDPRVRAQGSRRRWRGWGSWPRSGWSRWQRRCSSAPAGSTWSR